ncbi:MAG: hypothetical protein AB1522_04675 [Chloroflexota bacterium]
MCEHRNKVGDNYGLTCLDCGEVLEGYGYWGQSETCRHVWLKGEGGYECLYCLEWLNEETWQMFYGNSIGV